MENQAYLKEQILTYLGNKRSLLGFIEQGVNIAKEALGKEKLSCCDLFSGSGIVSRFLKSHANFIVANDLELYSRVTNECYLANADAEFKKELDFWHEKLTSEIGANLSEGFICELYAPKDEANISAQDRVFYTRKNAAYIDTARQIIEALVPQELRVFFVDFIVQRIDLSSDRFFVRFELFEFFFRFGKAHVELLNQILFAAFFFLNAD